MEFCEHSLEDKLRENEKVGGLDYSSTRHYIYQLFMGLDQMHQKGVSHRDLKPENILLKQTKKGHTDALSLQVKVADLGAAKVLDKS